VPGLPRAGEIARTMPGRYGVDRVTAMVVDPERLSCYWEVSDGAVARARDALGTAGHDAWLGLRVYDVTNRLFDGTNAQGFFDHRLERHDRQWFFHVGKPGSTACVELGVKSSAGDFVRIARSGRADFPRDASVGPGAVEWLTVRPVTAAGEPTAAERSGPGWDETDRIPEWIETVTHATPEATIDLPALGTARGRPLDR